MVNYGPDFWRAQLGGLTINYFASKTNGKKFMTF